VSKDVIAKKSMCGFSRHDLQRDKAGTSSDIDHASFGPCDNQSGSDQKRSCYLLITVMTRGLLAAYPPFSTI